MTIADQLGSVVFTSSYDVEVRQMLDTIFPFARVLPGPRIVQNIKSLTQSEGCDVCIKFTSGGLSASKLHGLIKLHCSCLQRVFYYKRKLTTFCILCNIVFKIISFKMMTAH